MREIAIYIHIPFCKQKCAYCDFCSFCANEKMVDEYFAILKNEIKNCKLKKSALVSSIYFGGGTPSSVDKKFIIEIINTIKSEFDVQENAEITIECNPCSTTKEKLKAYFDAGFNRVSFGVQTLNDNILKIIGRLHNAQQAINAIEFAKEVGFKNISCDLIIGLPNQTKEDLIYAINKFNELEINHISSYMLQLEEGTALYNKVIKNEVKIPSEEEQVLLYGEVVTFLTALGYEQYEVSNFAKNKAYSKHNLNYWRRGEYLGFGLSAHSFVDETRYANSTKIEEYKLGKIALKEQLTKKEIAEEIIMLGLRYFEGVDLYKLSQIDADFTAKIKESKYVADGIIKVQNGKAILDAKYYSINNEIIVNLI